ncbi:MAG: DNA-deoxyinosine glycosylase [Clostridia bacterium]|nr:DNA-deoxyinosine glycosylase [Clostridia bacterium]
MCRSDVEKEQFGLEPIVFDNSEILILGSLPGKKSFDEGMYFANRGNRFWKMIAGFYGEELPKDKCQMVSFLERHHIALWDVYESAVRRLSSDESMKKYKLNDILGFISDHPSITKVLVAGKKAQAGLKEHNENIAFIPVPSTSGANAHFDENEWYRAIFE